MIHVEKYRELLAEMRLTDLAQVKAYKGELIKDHKGRRDIQRITLSDGTRLYLKRVWHAHRKDGLRSLLTRGQVWSISREEYENCRALGIAAVTPVAYGEECGSFWEKFSFIITEEARGEQTVEQFLRECHDTDKRQRVFDALARFIRQLHNAGFGLPDLFTRHIFVDTETEPPQFCLIDVARLGQGRPRRARDLVALNITAPLRFVADEE